MRNCFYSPGTIYSSNGMDATGRFAFYKKKTADEILMNGKVYEDLRVLTKQVGGRLSGSSGMYKAEAWGQKALQQAGADKVWLQQCMVPH